MTNFEPSKKDQELLPKFLSETHFDLFHSVINQLNPSQRNNPEYQAVAFIVTSNDELYTKMNPYFGANGFNSIDMLEEEDFSSGYRLIAKAAGDLFGKDTRFL